MKHTQDRQPHWDAIRCSRCGKVVTAIQLLARPSSCTNRSLSRSVWLKGKCKGGPWKIAR